MRKHAFAALAIILVMSLLLSSCNVFHKHDLGEWQFNGSEHFRECACGYTLSQSSSKHIDKNRDDTCDICGYPMVYKINSLADLSWYLLYYFEVSQYEYLDESNMKLHSIHDMNFKNTLTYNEAKTRVKFEYPDFNEFLTSLPQYAEYIKSNDEYYSRHVSSGYSQHNIPLEYYLFDTQETIRYGSSENHCDYQRYTDIGSKFITVNEFYETSIYSKLTKRIYNSSDTYNKNNLSFKNEILNTVAGEISHFIRYYLNVEFTDHGEIILPNPSYFDCIDIKTENGIVYFNIEKKDGKTFFDDDIRYIISGSINLKTHDLSYNVKEGYYFDGKIMSYVDYDYDLTMTNEQINIEFDFTGEFEEIYMEKQ